MGTLDVPLPADRKQMLCALVALRRAGERLTGIVGDEQLLLGQSKFDMDALEDLEDAGYLTLSPYGGAGKKITLAEEAGSVCP